MSQETVQRAQRLMDALSNSDLETMLRLADPHVEWHSFFATLGEGGVYRGHAGTRAYVNDLREAWDVVRADVDDVIAVGDVALLVGRIHYRGKGSGIETETPAGWMLRFRGERLVRFRAFREPEQALESVGLPAA